MTKDGREPRCLVHERFLPTLRPLAVAAAAALFGLAAPLHAAVSVSMGVDVNDVLAVMPDVGIGLHTSVYANIFNHPDFPGEIGDGGIQMLRYPGGNYASIYHWSDHTATGGYAASASHFGNFVDLLMDGSGATGMVTINYGSSHQATMGGQPKEAAAWVAYANGDPNDTTSIGTDAEGNDWKTVGYWASLRGMTAAQNPDNQYDFLAIDHDDPLGIQYWEIGNEINGNGYYSDIDANWDWQYDLHSPYDGSRGNEPELSPTAYANHYNEFVAEMKAVDPTIKIGAVLAGPGGVGDVSDPSRNWDQNVLTIAGPNMDFGIYHWYVNNGSSTNTVLNATDDLPGIFDTIRSRMDTYVGAGASDEIDIHMTEFGYFGSVSNPAVDGVFSANTYATALEDGLTSVHWLELSKNSYLGDNAADNDPPPDGDGIPDVPPVEGPAYYGIQIFSHIAETGSEFVDTDSTSGSVETHATVLPDGSIGLLIANLANGTSNDADVTISINGDSLSDSGTQWLYGVNQSTPLVTNPSGLGNEFTVTVPYRSIVALLIPAAVAVPGDYNGNGTVDAADYVAWRDNFGTSGTPGTLVGDGTSTGDLLGVPDGLVDEWDFAYWRANFGATAGGGSGAAASTVPEPSTSLLAFFALVGAAIARVSSRRRPRFQYPRGHEVEGRLRAGPFFTSREETTCR